MPTRARLGMIVATESEARWVRRGLTVQTQLTGPAGALWQGELWGLDVALLRCGMGPARAASGLEWLLSEGALWGLLSLGFAGGLQPQLAVGDAIIVSAIQAADTLTESNSTRVVPHSGWGELIAAAAAQAGLVAHAGLLLSRTSILPRAVDKQELGRQSGAVAIDMESHALGCQAAAQRLPFCSMRTIFDTSDDDLTLPADTFTTTDGRLQLSRLLGYVGRHPQSLGQFPSLWRKARVSGQHLESWLAHFLALLGPQQSQ